MITLIIRKKGKEDEVILCSEIQKGILHSDDDRDTDILILKKKVIYD